MAGEANPVNARQKYGLLLALAAVCAAALYFWMPSDERRIHRLLTRLASEISTTAQGGTFAELKAANRVADLFAPEFQIQVNVSGAPELNLSERGELIQLFLNARSRHRSIKVDLLDPQTVRLGSREAVVEATGRAQVSGENEIWVAELRFTLVKVDGRWRIREVESIRTFE